MGVNIKDLLLIKEVKFEELNGKILAMDSFNILYQFLSTIRQRDGSLLKDSKGNVTSHLMGMFNRTTKFMKLGIKPIFVFDGKPPELKNKERERRKELKIEAEKKYKHAVKAKDEESMKKYASRTSRLTHEMVEESKELIDALGLPVVQAPSEGEAQVACIVNKGDAYAGVSEDYDSLLYGITRLVKNLTISGKRRIGANYVSVKPKMISISDNLNHLGIDQDQMIVLGILIGTDYNPRGIKGIGPKSALKLVKEFKQDYDGIFKKVEWDKFFDFPWTDIYYLIKKMPVEKNYDIKWKKIDKDRIIKMLIDKHDFAEERVNSVVEELLKKEESKTQTGLGAWFK